MSTTMLAILAIINGLLCASVCWVALCRITVMRKSTRRVARAAYVVVIGAALVSAAQMLLPPPLTSWPRVPDILASAALLLLLFAGRGAWRDGPPHHTVRPDYLNTDQMTWIAGGKQ